MIKMLLLIAAFSVSLFAKEIIINETLKIERKTSLTRDDPKNVITDNDTGIMWEDDYKIKKTWSEAGKYCQDLTLGGFDDWHLPTIVELESVVDYKENKPAIKRGFDNISSHIYWSSTSNVADTKEAWFVLFENGRSYILDKELKYYVKCSRAGDKKEAQLKKEGDVVKDGLTGIVWQDDKDAVDVKKDYRGAKKYCKELKLGGFEDWYLPRVSQLLSIVDKTKMAPAIKDVFENTKLADYWSSSYWTSTQHATRSNRVWFVHFGYGFSSDYGDKKTLRNIRCARAGESDGLAFDKLVAEIVEKEMNTIPRPSTREHLENRVLDKVLKMVWGKPTLTKLKYKGRKGYFVATLSFEGQQDFEQKVFIKISKKEHIKFKRNFKRLKPEAVFEYDGDSITLKGVRVMYKKKYFDMNLVDMDVADTKIAISIGKDIKFKKK